MKNKEKHTRLNAYRIMWLFVFFDLPTNTKKERKAAAGFRKGLMRDGFTMMQYSVYTRHCASKESAEVHVKRVKTMLPESGQVSITQITDKQYGNIINFWGAKNNPLPDQPQQLELFGEERYLPFKTKKRPNPGNFFPKTVFFYNDISM